MSHFVPCFKKSDATHVANIFFKEVLRLHGFPRSIVSNRDTRFVGHFWRTLWRKMGTNLSFGLAYHPQTDGQTKFANRSLGNILRMLVSEHPKQWEQVLPQDEFAYNDSPHISIGLSPFYIVYSMHPRGIYDLINLGKVEIISTYAKDFVAPMQSLHQ
jgi:hypothetical protein